jgi:hypothetical protein
MAKQVTPPTEITTQTDSQTQGSKVKKLFDRYADELVSVYVANGNKSADGSSAPAVKKQIKFSELGTSTYPFLQGYIYYVIELPKDKKEIEKIDHRNPKQSNDIEKYLMAVHEKDFAAIFEDFFSERNQLGILAFTFENPADLFWLYQGIMPEKFVEKFPKKFSADDDLDTKINTASKILASSATKRIGKFPVNIYEGDYENIANFIPTHIKKQF